MLTNVQVSILKHCEEFEKSVEGLYKVFKALFPQTGVWRILMQEEQFHAESVAKLLEMGLEGRSTFTEGRITPESVQKLIDYVKQLTESAKAGKYNARQALAVSLDLENSIIEANIFRRFTVSPEAVQFLDTLHDGTLHHIQMLRDELAKAG